MKPSPDSRLPGIESIPFGAGGGPNSAAVSFARLGENLVGPVLIAPGVTVEQSQYLPLTLR